MNNNLISFVFATTLGVMGTARVAHAQYYDPYAAYYAQQVQLEQMQRAQLEAQWEAQRQMAAAAMAENEAAQVAFREVQTEGWGRMNARVLRVSRQLEAWSGMTFQVVPSQQGTWGQAHDGGVISFDISSVVQSDSVMAFRLAHEWGHQALGHAANAYNPYGSAGRVQWSATGTEDEADEYAGAFLFAQGYDVNEVEATLRQYPTITGDSHSGGEKRAANVARGYARARSAASPSELVDDEYPEVDPTAGFTVQPSDEYDTTTDEYDE